MKITEGQFWGGLVLLLVLMGALGIRGLFLSDMEKIERADERRMACVEQGLSYAAAFGGCININMTSGKNPDA